MPQLILEYSSNIIETDNLQELLKSINIFLNETLPTELASCKSRAIKLNTFCIGNGDERNALVHVSLKVMPGRTFEKLNEVGNGIMKMLKDYFYHSLKQLSLQITVEISELEKTYYKFASS